MKKLLCLCLVLILSVSVIAGCGNKDEQKNEENPVVATENEATENEASEDTPEIAETPAADGSVTAPPKQNSPANNQNDNKVSESKDKPTVYIITKGGTDESNICYHLKGCNELKGTEAQVMQWEMVQALGFRQCKTCKPPKYEGYIE